MKIKFFNHKKIQLEEYERYEELIIDIKTIALFPIQYLENLDNKITTLIKDSSLNTKRPLLISFLGDFSAHEPSEEVKPFMELLTNLAFYACSTNDAAKREKRLSPPEKMVRKLVGDAALKRYINNTALHETINVRFVNRKNNKTIEVVF